VSKTREEYRTANAVGVNLPVCGENEVELQIEAWAETARQQLRNTEYYRGLVVSIGELFGEEARTADDGTVMDDVLCAKVPELVRHLDRRLANMQRYIMLLRERLVKVGDRVKALRFEAAKIACDWSIRLAAEEIRSHKLAAALRQVEWPRNYDDTASADDYECYLCYNNKRDGFHAPDCPIGQALAGERE
jgi:hypothetical protein